MALAPSPVWFITGCSTGLGHALAAHVLNRGWRAVVTARDVGTIAGVVDGHGDRALALPLDVTDPEQISTAVGRAEESFGRVDVAFAATGYYHATKYAVEGLSESLAAEVAPLGIGVTIVEPGAFRTNWSGPSMKQSPLRIDDYAETAGKRREATLATYGHQPGDPGRAATAIAAALEADQPPLRLLLGEVALQVARRKLDALRRDFAGWEHLTLSTEVMA